MKTTAGPCKTEKTKHYTKGTEKMTEKNGPHLFDILQGDVKASLDNTNQMLKLFDIQKFAENNPELQEKLMKMKNKCEVLSDQLEQEKDNWVFENV
jgi:hypothetical protein